MVEKLIILPGWRERIESFDSLINILKEEIEIVVIPLPGFQEKLERPYTFEDYLNYLEEKLKNLENFYLMGHSFGGALAMLYALNHPQKIKKLILYNSAVIREKTFKKRLILFLAKILKPLEKIFPQKISFLFKKIFYRFFVKSYDYFLVDENLKKTFANINQDLREKAKELKVKTILLWGKNDKATPLKQALILKNLIPDSELIVLKGGHNLHQENLEEFVKNIKNVVK